MFEGLIVILLLLVCPTQSHISQNEYDSIVEIYDKIGANKSQECNWNLTLLNDTKPLPNIFGNIDNIYECYLVIKNV